jgi:hypothetical protein
MKIPWDEYQLCPVHHLRFRIMMRLRELPFNEVSVLVKYILGLDKSDPSDTVIGIAST